MIITYFNNHTKVVYFLDFLFEDRLADFFRLPDLFEWEQLHIERGIKQKRNCGLGIRATNWFENGR
jgi:hypothetical protein